MLCWHCSNETLWHTNSVATLKNIYPNKSSHLRSNAIRNKDNKNKLIPER